MDFLEGLCMKEGCNFPLNSSRVANSLRAEEQLTLLSIHLHPPKDEGFLRPGVSPHVLMQVREASVLGFGLLFPRR